MATKKHPKTIWRVTNRMWKDVKPLLPPEKQPGTPGRPAVPFRQVLDGILYVLRTGCQWKAVPQEFGSGSTVHRRFQEWTGNGLFQELWVKQLQRYARFRGIGWRFQSLDSALVKAPLGGRRQARTPRTGANAAPNATS
jgi:transposase